MITCCCITRGDRLGLLADSVADFAGQTFAERELLILHDGDAETDDRLRALAAGAAMARVVRVPPGRPLGALRNEATAQARGTWLCQWDDDDRYHPDRLALQFAAASDRGTGACYLVDQLHWFREDGTLTWDDWDREPYPMNLVQGTLLARRDLMPPYPERARGEDTLHTHAMLRAEAAGATTIARLRGVGWCTVYTYHGGNVWDEAHHRAIAAAKHLHPARLLPLLPMLRKRLAEYRPALPRLEIPLGSSREAVCGPVPPAAGELSASGAAAALRPRPPRRKRAGPGIPAPEW